jgi:hypothetical protein
MLKVQVDYQKSLFLFVQLPGSCSYVRLSCLSISLSSAFNKTTNKSDMSNISEIPLFYC